MVIYDHRSICILAGQYRSAAALFEITKPNTSGWLLLVQPTHFLSYRYDCPSFQQASCCMVPSLCQAVRYVAAGGRPLLPLVPEPVEDTYTHLPSSVYRAVHIGNTAPTHRRAMSAPPVPAMHSKPRGHPHPPNAAAALQFGSARSRWAAPRTRP